MSMDNMPLVSVLMGIYNCEETLEEAVNCIVNQTYKNWELIMCDDCSSDGTIEIAEKLARKDSRIKLIKNEENLTLAPTLNHCLSIARGKYVARMDGDDVCSLNRFDKEIEFLENNSEYALVSCNMDLFDKNGVYKTILYKEKPLKQDFVKTSQFCHAGCMIRTEVIRKLGGYSEEVNKQRVEDYDLWVRMYTMGFKGYNIQENLYAMRDDRNALHRRTLKNRMNEVRVKIDVCRKFKLSIAYYIYILIPLAKYFVPKSLYNSVHKNSK